MRTRLRRVVFGIGMNSLMLTVRCWPEASIFIKAGVEVIGECANWMLTSAMGGRDLVTIVTERT